MTARGIYVRDPSVLDASATSFLPLGGSGTLAVGSFGTRVWPLHYCVCPERSDAVIVRLP
jgi:hypothetical protein